jgi:RimJ/RimL family protein N-acetyltransferase
VARTGRRGKGLGRASLAALLAHLHDEVRVPALWMGTSDSNRRTIAQIESTGARMALAEPHTLPNGRVVPGRWYVHEGTPAPY